MLKKKTNIPSLDVKTQQNKEVEETEKNFMTSALVG